MPRREGRVLSKLHKGFRQRREARQLYQLFNRLGMLSKRVHNMAFLAEDVSIVHGPTGVIRAPD
jgi:hypothetical protein